MIGCLSSFRAPVTLDCGHTRKPGEGYVLRVERVERSARGIYLGQRVWRGCRACERAMQRLCGARS